MKSMSVSVTSSHNTNEKQYADTVTKRHGTKPILSDLTCIGNQG